MNTRRGETKRGQGGLKGIHLFAALAKQLQVQWRQTVGLPTEYPTLVELPTP